MATKVTKLHDIICSDCRSVLTSMLGLTAVEEFTSCPKCGAQFDLQQGPLSASNKTANLPQSGVKYYG